MKRCLLFINIVAALSSLSIKVSAQKDQHVSSGENTTTAIFPATGCLYKWTNNTPGIGLAATGFGNILSFTATNTGTTPVTATITATPIPSGYAYIANYGSNDVSVISTLSNTVIATIPVGTKPFGVSVNTGGTLVYITNEGSNTVSVIDVLTNTVTATIPVGLSPRGVAVSPDDNRVYVANSGSNTVSVIDAAANSVLSVIPAGLGPYGIVVGNDGTRVYGTDHNSNVVSIVDPLLGIIVDMVGVGGQPSGIAISPDGTKIYVSNSGVSTVTAFNIADISKTTLIHVGGQPEGLTFSPDGKRVYVAAMGDGLLTTIPVGSISVSSFAAATLPEGISVTPDGSFIYLADVANNVVRYISSDFTVPFGGRIQVGTYPRSLGNFIARGPACSGTPVTFNITVDPPPIITASAVIGSISACAGMASSSPNIEQFTVSGSGLSADIVVTAPVGFEISTDAVGGYSNSLTLSQAGGLVNSTLVYVRSAASAGAGGITGKVVLSSVGAPAQNVAVSGVVNALPTVNGVTDQEVLTGTATNVISFTGTANTFSWVNDTPGIGLAASGTGNIPSFTTVNKSNSAVKATIKVTPLPAPAYAYIANTGDGTVSVIDLATKAVVGTVRVGIQPLGVAVSPDGKRVYVTNENLGGVNPSTVSVINTANNAVIATIVVGYRPQGIVVSPDGTRVYVANMSPSNTVSVINTANNAVIFTIQTGTENPTGLAISPDGASLYLTSSSSNNVTLINTSTNTIVSSVITGPNPHAVVVSPDGSRVYVANSSADNVTVVNAAANSVLYNIDVGRQPEGLALSPDGSKTYVTNASSGTVSVISNITNLVTAIIPVGTFPWGISINGDGSRVYASNQGSNNVSVINTADNSVLTTIDAGTNPYSFGGFVTKTTDCTGIPISFSITADAIPVINAANPLAGVGTTYGTSSVSVSFAVSGTNMSAGILVTPPAGFELSTDNITFSNTVTAGGAGNIAAIPVYIRLGSGTNAGVFSGNIILSSPGAENVTLLMPNSTVSPATLTIAAGDINKIYGSVLTGSTNSTDFTITAGALQNGNTINSVIIVYGTGAEAAAAVGTYPTISPIVNTGTNGFLPGNYSITYTPGNINVTPAPLLIIANDLNKSFGTALTAGAASTAFTEIGLQNQENVGSVTVTYGNGAAGTDPIGVYPASVTPSSATAGTFTAGNYTIIYKTGNINVLPPVAIIASGVLSPLTTVYGTPSASVSFVVAGTGLPSAILVAPPPGFEVSTDNSRFYPIVNIGQAGDIAAVPVYIRLAGIRPVGSYAGNILLSSGAISASEIMPNSTVTAAPLTVAADNKSKVAGSANPAFTVSYAGFVNNESAAQLLSKPVITTEANTSSPTGEYEITVSGASSINYAIVYVPGILTINALPPSVTVPNVFTPNGDGVNDVWSIPSLTFYPKSVVRIFNRYGQPVYYSAGYAKPWDGIYSGAVLPVGAYYYVIQLGYNLKTLSGEVTILR